MEGEGRMSLFTEHCQPHTINLMLRSNYLRCPLYSILLAAINRPEPIVDIIWNFLENGAIHIKLNSLICAVQSVKGVCGWDAYGLVPSHHASSEEIILTDVHKTRKDIFEKWLTQTYIPAHHARSRTIAFIMKLKGAQVIEYGPHAG